MADVPGMAGSLRLGKHPAIVCIDMVQAYVSKGSGLSLPSSDFATKSRIVLNAGRAAGVPIFHTRVEYLEGELEQFLFPAKVPALRSLVRGLPSAEFIDGVAPKSGEKVLIKKQASAFFGTDLESLLRDLGVDTVILLGVSTSGCIRATVVDAIARGLVPVVVREAVGDRTEGIGNASLSDIQDKYGEVRGVKEVVEYLSGGKSQALRGDCFKNAWSVDGPGGGGKEMS